MTIDDEPMLTLEEALALLPRLWDEIERSVFEYVASQCIAAGFAESDVKLVIEERARVLREGRAARLATAKQMLEHRCAAVH